MEIQEGYKQTEVGVIPQDWEVRELGDIAEIKRGKFTPRPRNDPKYYGGDIPFVQTGDVTDSKGKISKYSQTLNKEGLEVSVLFKKGTILMTIAANIGYTGILQIDMACTDSLVAINGLKNYDNNFLNCYFTYKRPELENLSTSGAQKNLSIELLKPFKIAIPPTKAEQTAIAAALHDADALISSLESLIAKKRNIKQGAMQELLKPKEGWEVKAFTDIILKNEGIKIGPFGSQLKKDLLVEKGFKVYGQENVFEKNMEIGSRFIKKEHFHKLKSCELLPGDFIISMMGTIGKRMIVPHNIEKGIMDSHLIRLRLDKNIIDVKFLYHFFSSEIIKSQVSRLSVGGIMDGLSSKIVKNLTIALPSKIGEQNKIAEILTNMDAEIESLERKLEKYKLIKQGMMQNLLTGRIRLV